MDNSIFTTVRDKIMTDLAQSKFILPLVSSMMTPGPKRGDLNTAINAYLKAEEELAQALIGAEVDPKLAAKVDEISKFRKAN